MGPVLGSDEALDGGPQCCMSNLRNAHVAVLNLGVKGPSLSAGPLSFSHNEGGAQKGGCKQCCKNLGGVRTVLDP